MATAEGKTHFPADLSEHQAISRNHFPALSRWFPHSVHPPWLPECGCRGSQRPSEHGILASCKPPWCRGGYDRFPPLYLSGCQCLCSAPTPNTLPVPAPGDVPRSQRAGTSPLTFILLSALLGKQQRQARGPAPAHATPRSPRSRSPHPPGTEGEAFQARVLIQHKKWSPWRGGVGSGWESLRENFFLTDTQVV